MDEYFEYLDHLRDSGRTNMFAAAGYLGDAFPELSYEQAVAVLKDWMERKKKTR